MGRLTATAALSLLAFPLASTSGSRDSSLMTLCHPAASAINERVEQIALIIGPEEDKFRGYRGSVTWPRNKQVLPIDSELDRAAMENRNG